MIPAFWDVKQISAHQVEFRLNAIGVKNRPSFLPMQLHDKNIMRIVVSFETRASTGLEVSIDLAILVEYCLDGRRQ